MRKEVSGVDDNKKDLEQAAMDFCIRVLKGDGQPQETAILPQILDYLAEMQEEKKSRQD